MAAPRLTEMLEPDPALGLVREHHPPQWMHRVRLYDEGLTWRPTMTVVEGPLGAIRIPLLELMVTMDPGPRIARAAYAVACEDRGAVRVLRAPVKVPSDGELGRDKAASTVG